MQADFPLERIFCEQHRGGYTYDPLAPADLFHRHKERPESQENKPRSASLAILEDHPGQEAGSHAPRDKTAVFGPLVFTNEIDVTDRVKVVEVNNDYEPQKSQERIHGRGLSEPRAPACL